MTEDIKIFAAAHVDTALRSSGAERVSEDATDLLNKWLTELARDIGKRAFEVARHANRKTIKAEDVQMIVKNYKL